MSTLRKDTRVNFDITITLFGETELDDISYISKNAKISDLSSRYRDESPRVRANRQKILLREKVIKEKRKKKVKTIIARSRHPFSRNGVRRRPLARGKRIERKDALRFSRRRFHSPPARDTLGSLACKSVKLPSFPHRPARRKVRIRDTPLYGQVAPYMVGM